MKKSLTFLLLSLIVWSCASTNENKQNTLNYNIVEKEDVSYSNTPRMVYRIVLDVDSIPSDEAMRNTAISIWENGNKQWSEFTTFFYLPETDTKSIAFGVGEFNKNGIVRFNKNEFSLSETKWDTKKTLAPVIK